MSKVVMPFEHFELKANSLEELIDHLIVAIEPHDIIGIVNRKVNRSKVIQNKTLVNVVSVGVGLYNNNQLIEYSKDVFELLHTQLLNLTENRTESISEKIDILENCINSCQKTSRYFDSMNSIRFASRIRFRLRDLNFGAVKHGADADADLFPLALIHLSAEQWKYIREAMALRRDIFQETFMELQRSYDELIRKYYSTTTYKLRSKTPQQDIMELYLALVRSEKIEFIEGDDDTFLKDLTNFFGAPVVRKAYTIGKVMERLDPANFLNSLAQTLESESTHLKGIKKKAHKKKTG